METTKLFQRSKRRNYQYQLGGHSIGTDGTAAMTGFEINIYKKCLICFKNIRHWGLKADLSAIRG